MDITAFTHGRRWAALLAVVPVVAACGGDPGARPDGAPPALARGTHLVITTDNGVRLRPAGGDRATLAAEHTTGHWSHGDGTSVLDLSCSRHEDHAGDCPRMPVIGVPAGVSVTVTARNAGIDVAGIPAGLDLTTVNGDVTVARSGESDATVRLVTRNGSVRAGTLRSASLHAETVNGDVTLGSATSPSRLTALTTNGSVRVALPGGAPAYEVAATTRNGRTAVSVPVSTQRGGHDMTLTTVNGDVTATRD
ncbi:DUF4097 family beta strand repeat-containing protein [Streptomyces sp. B1I3]|uniref:DUF4097 family beta strand repeat-containing protein n=1 Tax=Streptomyces sp. B1I3 TaxID=3042264 RepID=UPI0027851E24|nr:DUF4097 family beta strand repeat-containing protein [Streptomyces sp. B1I3]MDQ0793813.1 hypothetical protein [Streptomyces sp. B1I3]